MNYKKILKTGSLGLEFSLDLQLLQRSNESNHQLSVEKAYTWQYFCNWNEHFRSSRSLASLVVFF